MKYKCLILDHDDTVVNSTATIHYPCFIEFLSEYRKGFEDNYTFEDFIQKNFTPGILSLFRDELKLSEEELAIEGEYWDRYVKTRIPSAYEGIGEVIKRFRDEGGIIAVSSHSLSKYIERDYDYNALPKPDMIYGWDLGDKLRKPNPYAVYDLIERYGFQKSEMLMVDDLKTGFDMSHSAGIDFAAAGWAYNVPMIKEFMKNHSDFYLRDIKELEELLFGD